MKKGDTYYTFWTTSLSGPHTYDGKSNFNFKGVLTGDPKSLEKVKLGYDYIYAHTDHEEEYDFVKRVVSMVSHKNIDFYIDKIGSNVVELEELKKYTSRIQQVVSGSI